MDVHPGRSSHRHTSNSTVKEKLLRMPEQWVFHPDPQLLNLVAWRIGGGDSERRVFEERLLNWQQGISGIQQSHVTTGESECLSIGVTGLRIPMIPL